MRRTFFLACLATGLLAVLPAAASAASLGSRLGAAMRPAGGSSGAYVVNATTGKPVLRYRHMTPRILASNTKIFTTAAALARYGVSGRLSTEVRGVGTLEENGTYRGDLYLVGGGDPTFGSSSFSRRSYGGGATVQRLASELERVGVRRVTGRIYGDESKFDSRRGGPESRYRISPYVGPLSGLAYNRGLASESGRGYQANPPAFAAARLDAALARRDISVKGAPRAKGAPGAAIRLVNAQSPTMSRLAALTNKPSDNFFAEMLVKDLALQAGGKGTTRAGTRLAAGFARRLGGGPAGLADGSGLSRGNRAAPYRVAQLLLAMRGRDEYRAFFNSLSIAGRDGTLGPRMRGGAARGRCRGKTGTISGVTAVSGYCTARSGEVYVYSILMNGVNAFGGRAIQDRMLNAIAASG
ncbi:MAG TPA: D-alanyl-D-alanine carboxypeptidase [Thermoleophilaceae bacterium]|nr:D-alanyl-D-alanine carboxypeptidase [Thermoleophilaceae bacterium]